MSSGNSKMSWVRGAFCQLAIVLVLATQGRAEAHASAAAARTVTPSRRGGGVSPTPLPGRRFLKRISTNPMDCDAWSGQYCQLLSDGSYQVQTYSDGAHGAMVSPRYYYNGVFSARIKFQKGYTGGQVTALYLIDTITTSNTDPAHSEIDFEFYGGDSEKEITMTTNVWCGGKQNLAQYNIPFDPSEDFHTYSINWNNNQITWSIDGQAFRILSRTNDQPWPSSPTRFMFSVWDSSSWSTLKTNYDNGPLSTWIRDIQTTACPCKNSYVVKKQCYRKSKKLPWNAPMTSEQVNASSSLSETILRKQYGWDG